MKKAESYISVNKFKASRYKKVIKLKSYKVVIQKSL